MGGVAKDAEKRRDVQDARKDARKDAGDGRDGRGGRKGLRPGDEMYAPFNVAFSTGMRYFEWLERRENVFRLKRCGKAMTGTSGWEGPGAVLVGMSSGRTSFSGCC